MKITIVIPTRSRAATLLHTLKASLEQDYEPLEVLVSDNESSDQTEDVVRSFRDPRLRYVRTGARLSMSGNWEFALRHATVGFVTLVGDDDALVAGAVREMAALLSETGTSVLSWAKIPYYWPNHPEVALRGLIRVPLTRGLTRVPAREAAFDVARFRLDYTYLPMLYNSLVRVDVLEAVRRRGGGRVFNSAVPDIYSGLAIAREIDDFVRSERPLGIGGNSGASSGTAFGRKVADSKAREQFLAENELAPHPLMPLFRGSAVSAVAEALFRANDWCYDGRLPVRRALAVERIFQHIRTAASDVWQSAVEEMTRHAKASQDSELQGLVERFSNRYPNAPAPTVPRMPRGFSRMMLNLDSTAFGVENVRDAAVLARKLLGEPEPLEALGTYRSIDKVAARAWWRLSSVVRDPLL